MHEPQEKFMEAAIEMAKQAYLSDDYAIGAVVIKNNQIIAKGANRIKTDNNPTHHAEIVAITECSKKLKNRHLRDCVLYTTHEPCPMCTAAAIWARMSGIISGARMEDMIEYRSQNGNDDWSWRTIDIPAQQIIDRGDPKLFIIKDFMRQKCVSLFHASRKTKSPSKHRLPY